MKKILLGLAIISTVSMASNSVEGTFSNKIGINYGTKGNEKWDDMNDTKNIFDTSIGLNYKLLYNVTNRFRWGGEAGYSSDSYGSSVKDNTDISDDRIGMLMLGLTGEYDIYQNDTLAIYLNGSLGGAYNETKFKFANISSKLTAKAYAKLGLGARFNNGLGLEVGRKGIAYDYTGDGADDTMARGLTYFELNYTF